MAGKAREALGAETIEAFADRGYFKSDDIAACEEEGIEAYVPRPLTSNARAEGRYDRRDFVYDAKSDTYVCPASSPTFAPVLAAPCVTLPTSTEPMSLESNLRLYASQARRI